MIDEVTRRVSVAVGLIDDFSPYCRVVGDVRVTLADQPWKAIENRLGYRVFTDLPPGDFVVLIASERYLQEERKVSLPLPDPSNPFLEVRLKPKWCYPFPQGSTTIAGIVMDTDGAAVAGVTVRVAGRPPETWTSADGRFVLYFKGLTEDDVSPGLNPVIKIGGKTSFQIEFAHSGYLDQAVTVQDIAEGAATAIASPVLLTRKGGG